MDAAAAEGVPALQALDVSHAYAGGFGRPPRPALHRLSLALPPGRVLGLVGPNGSGKSTFVRAAAGLLRPGGGSIAVFGRPAGSRAALADLGYLPENPRLPPRLSAREALRLYAALSGVPRARRAGRIEEGLERFGLAPEADRPLGGFSKGMAQKVALLQALVHRPRLLLLDEPTSGLDPLSQKLFFETVASLRDRGAAVLLSSHLLAAVEEACDDVAVLHRGRLLRHGPVEELTRLRRRLEARLRTGDDPAALERSLREAGFDVEAVRPAVRSLADVFLDLSEEDDRGEDHGRGTGRLS